MSYVRLGNYDFNIKTVGLHINKFKSLCKVILTLYSIDTHFPTMFSTQSDNFIPICSYF